MGDDKPNKRLVFWIALFGLFHLAFLSLFGVIPEDEGLVLEPWSFQWLMARTHDLLLFPCITVLSNVGLVHPIIQLFGFVLNLVFCGLLIERAVNGVRSVLK
jgi:hypothetical protein